MGSIVDDLWDNPKRSPKVGKECNEPYLPNNTSLGRHEEPEHDPSCNLNFPTAPCICDCSITKHTPEEIAAYETKFLIYGDH